MPLCSFISDPALLPADLKEAALEAKLALCGALEGLLHRTGLRPCDIDILVGA